MSDHLARQSARTINAALFEIIKSWLEANCPGCHPESLSLTVRDGRWKKRKIRFPILPIEAETDDAPEPETPMERDILTALGDSTMKGEELCAESGYSWGGRFRGHLSRMVQAGLLVKCADGYKRGTLSPE